MNKEKLKNLKRLRRQKRTRAKISGTDKRPRLNVFKSNKAVYLQIIDDIAGKTLVSARSEEIKEKGDKTEIAFKLGKLIAEKAQKAEITEVVFDKAGFAYHGRVKAVAEGAREGGLKF